MRTRHVAFGLVLCVMCCFSAAHGNLITIGTADYAGGSYKLIYEDTQNLVWLDYVNTDSDWTDQALWALGLNVPGVLTYHLNPGIAVDWATDSCWRLPKTVDGPYVFGYDGTTTAGFNITTSEKWWQTCSLEFFGNKGFYTTTGQEVAFGYFWGLINTVRLMNLVAGVYWSGNESAFDTRGPWHFQFGSGCQDIEPYVLLAMDSGLAVREGTVSLVPVPGAALLGVLGLG